MFTIISYNTNMYKFFYMNIFWMHLVYWQNLYNYYRYYYYHYSLEGPNSNLSPWAPNCQDRAWSARAAIDFAEQSGSPHATVSFFLGHCGSRMLPTT